MDIRQALNNGRLIFDGGTGTMLQRLGLRPGERPEEWNLSAPEKITALHTAYLEAGCNLIKTNTFGANRLRFGERTAELVRAAVQNARAAVTDEATQAVALDIGPCGKLLKPLGELDFEDVVSLFAEVVRAGAEQAELILIETMNDAYETKAAVLAAKENCSLPIFVTNVYDDNHQLMTGADPLAMVALLEGLGVDALGMNCSLGPKQMLELLPELLAASSLPVIINPNAGLPRSENGQTVYDVAPAEFASYLAQAARLGARVLGGCCGTTPEYIRALVEATKALPVREITNKGHTLVSSYTHAVQLGKTPVLIGERINPTGKKQLQQALREQDINYVLALAAEQAEHEVALLDVNVGLPGIDERALLVRAVQEIQGVTDLPLQLDSSDPAALEAAMRRYNGKPLVNSVNGKKESMAAVFPLLKRYGGVVIALTLDEDGIPQTAAGRVEIARNILRTAADYGIGAQQLVFDPLTLPVSAQPDAGAVTLEALRLLKQELGVKTCIGVSNCSFGLPDRESLNTAFLAMALAAGLDAAIVNPLSEALLRAFAASRVLLRQDESCRAYLARTQRPPQPERQELSVRKAIESGLAAAAAEAAKKALQTRSPLALIDEQVVPALDAVGRGFEEKTVFLPQLLMSAEAASAAFAQIKQVLAAQGKPADKGVILLATVQGDIHDIGKNIVRVLLENYGYRVIDLGRDVPPATIAARAAAEHIALVGLSALMTTTVPAMEQSIRLLREQAPWAKIMVGGAVLTREYAEKIGADAYGSDAMQSVRIAEQVFSKEDKHEV